MPLFLCPCCSDLYSVPLAFCESILEEHMRRGWKGTIAPARCVACQLPVHRGDSVTIRGGAGISHGGERHELSPGISALVLETSTWENEDSIFLVRLPDDVEVFVARHQLAPGVACTGKPPGDGSRG